MDGKLSESAWDVEKAINRKQDYEEYRVEIMHLLLKKTFKRVQLHNTV